MALTQALGVGVRIEYLDGRHFRGQLDQITLPEGAQAKVKLLYRYWRRKRAVWGMGMLTSGVVMVMVVVVVAGQGITISSSND